VASYSTSSPAHLLPALSTKCAEQSKDHDEPDDDDAEPEQAVHNYRPRILRAGHDEGRTNFWQEGGNLTTRVHQDFHPLRPRGMAIYSKATGACAQEDVFKIYKRGHFCSLVDGKFSQNFAIL